MLYLRHAGNSEISEYTRKFLQKIHTSMIESCSHHQGFTVPPSSMVKLLIQNVSPTVRRLVKSFNSGTGKTCSSRSSRPSECMLPCMAHLELENDGLRMSLSYFILRCLMKKTWFGVGLEFECILKRKGCTTEEGNVKTQIKQLDIVVPQTVDIAVSARVLCHEFVVN